MILRILVLFSSPFSSWEIPKYPFLAQILILLSMLGYDHIWPSNGHPIRWAPVTSNDRCPHGGNDDAQRFQRIISHLTQATLFKNFRDTWAIFMSCIGKDRGHTVQQGNWSFIFILGIQKRTTISKCYLLQLGNFYLSSILNLNKRHVICWTCYFWQIQMYWTRSGNCGMPPVTKRIIPDLTGDSPGFTGRSVETNIDLATPKLGGLRSHCWLY